MFNNSLPPLSHDHRPLRLTSEVPRAVPSGECRWAPLNASVQNQRCSCQSFNHNRSAPGTICDCGHQACYHVHIPAQAQDITGHDRFQMATSASLVDRIRRLEEALNNERQIRENLIHEERRTRDREVRILREALHPFYKSEEDMRRKLLELEDHLEGNYDEYIRLRDRIVTLDDANMTLEKRIDELEGSRKRRRVSRDPTDDGLHSGLTSKRGSNPSSSDDKLYPRPEPRRRLSPARRPPFVRPEPESPRSSGILNLVKIPRSPPPAPPQPHGSPPSEGARSSGFLALDLAERFNRRMAIPTTRSSPPSTAAPLHPPTTLPALHSTSHSPPDARDIPRPNTTQAPGTPSLADPTRQILLADTTKRSASVEVMEISPTANGNGNGNPNPNGMAAADADSPKKRKRDPQHLMALDVLANVSVASPLA